MIYFYQPYWEELGELEHYGILGMKWGIRRSPEELGHKMVGKGVQIWKDGRIQIDEGIDIQRISRDRELNPMHRTYASITKYDHLRYVVDWGKDDGRDYVIQMRTTEKLKAPSTKEAVIVLSDSLIENPSYINVIAKLAKGKNLKITADDLAKNKSGKTATDMYVLFNKALSISPDDVHWIGKLQESFTNKLTASGYNALLDENDFRTSSVIAPIIVFDPNKSLKMIGLTEITDELKRSSYEQLSQYETISDRFIEKLLSMRN